MLVGIAAASVQGVAAMGQRRGVRVRRLGDPSEEVESPVLGRCHARLNGFDLHASLVVPAGQRERLERVCRYALRPPVTQERLSVTGEGQVLLQLRHPWTDGTTHLLFDPIELLERLAVLVPRPRINLVLYHGVLAPRAAWRSHVIRHEEPSMAGDVAPTAVTQDHADAPDAAHSRPKNGRLWAELMQRTFGFDVLACPRCGGRLQLIALIDQAAVIQRILRHLGLPAEVPETRPARAPPLAFDAWQPAADHDIDTDDPST